MPYPEKLSLGIIWDEISHFLDSTKDLLSLALTCQAFKELIIPDHLEYRHIRCNLRNKDFWTLLGNRPRLARCVRFVELMEDPQEMSRLRQTFDRTQYAPVTVEHIALVKKSLSHMTLLKEFAWKQPPTSLAGFFDISNAVTSASHRLEALSVELDEWLYDFPWTQLESLSIWSLTGLTNVIMSEPNPAATEMVLYSCPNIEYLRLTHLTDPKTLCLMRDANWKKLRRLTLSSHMDMMSFLEPAEDIDAPTVIVSFFDRHTSIECLSLTLYDLVPPKLPSSCLPKLRSIEYETGNSQSLALFLSDDTISRLVHWQTYVLNTDNLPQMEGLQSFRASDWFRLNYYAPFFLKTPNLKKVSMSCVDVERELWPYDQLIRPFLRCSNLTHIEFRDFPLTSFDGTDNPEPLGYLCWGLSPLRSLKYLRVIRDKKEAMYPEEENMYTRHSMLAVPVKDMYVELKRDKNGRYLGYEFVTLKEAGGDSDYWGDFFFHLCPETAF